MADTNKASTQEKLGYIGLGVCLDYFIFKPMRSLRPLLYISIGFVLGMIYSFGIKNIFVGAKNILGF